MSELIERGLINHEGKGVFIYMDNRVDKSVTFSGGQNKNIAVNTGEGTINQTITESTLVNDNLETLIEKLLSEIPKVSDPEDIEDAIDNVGKIKSAIESDDKSRAKKIFNWLPTVVQACSSAVELFKLISETPK